MNVKDNVPATRTEQSSRDIPLRLKACREAAGYNTGTAAAKELGVSVATYNAHENGHRGLTVTAAIQYATFFRVSLDWLILGKAHDSSDIAARSGTKTMGDDALANIVKTAMREVLSERAK
jgi:DNA-binding XRE family transcriptional regulator